MVQKNLVVLYSAAIVALHKDVSTHSIFGVGSLETVVLAQVSLQTQDVGSFLNRLLTWATDEAVTVAQREAALHAVASVINRRPNGKLFQCRQKTRWYTSHSM